MCFGFEHGDGWFNIIYMLSSALEQLATKFPDLAGNLRAAQVKEKFGGLRFYLDGYPSDIALYEIVEGLIDSAEYLSVRTCETCGRPGVRRCDGWISTLCDEHGAGRPEWSGEGL